jgi:hypothetical protein
MDQMGPNVVQRNFSGLAKWIEGSSDQHRVVGYCLSYVAPSAPALAKFLAVWPLQAHLGFCGLQAL